MGLAESFTCPDHGWQWAVDGQLARVPDPAAFPDGVPESSSRLKGVACTEWAGFVWVFLSPDPPPLSEFLGAVAPLIDVYRPQDYALVEDLTLAGPCNWKVCVDAFNEVYHLRSVHPEILGFVDDVNV